MTPADIKMILVVDILHNVPRISGPTVFAVIDWICNHRSAPTVEDQDT
jgi:hypothetical protein